ncbi:unnamed protein product [Prunus armeniaca]
MSKDSSQYHLCNHTTHGPEILPDKKMTKITLNPRKGTQSSSASGDAKPKKNWKSKGKKWDSKPQNSVNQGGKPDQAKGKCTHFDKLHYGECWFKGKPQCYGCNRFGHYIKECDQANKAGKVANLANQSLLVNIDKNVKCRVKMGAGDLVQSTSKGTLVIEMQGVTRYIKEVMIVPGLDENLLSVGQMVEHGYWLVFSDNMIDIYRDRQMQDLIASVPMKGNRCFPLSLEYVKPSMANKVTVEESSWLWHKRYGHLNYTSLMLLQDKEMVQGLPRLQVTKHVCSGCAIGKGHREPFDKEKVWRASQPLELIHSDICGPMQITTLAGNRFFLTFIDDHSRMCWIFFLQHKSHVFIIFKRFKSMVELQSGYKLKKLRSDRERKNRTVVEMARTMMHEKKIPFKFWAEVVNTAVYLQNRSPTSALDNTTPFEKFSGRKPGVKHLRIFGSLCYIHIPSQKRHKLEETGEKGVFDWESNEAQVEVTIPWNDEQSSMTSEFDSEASDSPQSVQSPLRTQAVSDLQATMDSVTLDSSVSTSETYDHTLRKWKKFG